MVSAALLKNWNFFQVTNDDIYYYYDCRFIFAQRSNAESIGKLHLGSTCLDKERAKDAVESYRLDLNK